MASGGGGQAGTPGTGAAKERETGRVSFLDQALWKQLSDAETPETFAKAWLALQCRIIDGVSRAVVVLGNADTGPFAPAAFWPDGESGSAGLTSAAESAMAERRGVVQGHEQDAGRLIEQSCHVAYPFLVEQHLYGVVALEISGGAGAHLRAVMRQLQWGAAWIEFMLHRRGGEDDRRVGERTMMALDLVATALEEERFRAACAAAVTELAIRLECERVSVGFVRRGHSAVVALSHSAEFGKRMDLIRAIGAAMDEAIDQRTAILYPPGEEGEMQVTRAHAELARGIGAATVLTIPLTVNDEHVGAIAFERREGRSFDQAAVELCECVTAVLGPILEEKRRNDRWLIFKIGESFLDQVKRLAGPGYFGRKLATAAAIAVVVFFYFATGDYRVTADAAIEGLVQRVTVAPFDGYIASEHARAGDVVRANQILAALDDKDLGLERLRWVTTRQQRLREYDRALAQRDRAEVKIIKVQIEQADAQIELIDEQLARAQLYAPFDGLVVSGDLSQSIGAPVQRGQVLFEIAPLNAYRVILEVDESEIAVLETGQRGKLLLSSMPDERYDLTVEKITPVAEAKEGRNFFRVEAKLDVTLERLRPGMEGVAKITIERRRLIWIWTRAMVDWFRVWSWSFWP